MIFPALPEMTCPRCGHTETDHDGFGMLACEECGWCSHPDRYGDQCQACGHRESAAGHVRDQALVVDAATGGAVSKSEVEALCDLADAADEYCQVELTHERSPLDRCTQCGCQWPCPTERIRAALARLGG